jgi:Zn-dependent protease
VIPLVIAIVFHEVSHGWVANLLGDPTAAEQGRLTFNPIPHIDPVGTVVLPLMLAVAGAPVFGWARPVPVDTGRLRNPRIDSVLVSAAGPMMNFFLGLLAVGAIALLLQSVGRSEFTGGWLFLALNLQNFLLINIFLAVFNMLPIYPFDGGHVLEGLLPRGAAAEFRKLEPYGFLIMVTLIVVMPMLSPSLNLIGRIVVPLTGAITDALLGSLAIGV